MNIEQVKRTLLILEIDEELQATDYIRRTHGTLSCYNAGCKGPLCRYANSLRGRHDRGSISRMDPASEKMIIQSLKDHHQRRTESKVAK